MEQSLADLTLRRVVNPEEAFAHTNRRDILAGILERSGLDVRGVLATLELSAPPVHQLPDVGLRVAGGPA
jgi:hypothetical protein